MEAELKFSLLNGDISEQARDALQAALNGTRAFPRELCCRLEGGRSADFDAVYFDDIESSLSKREISLRLRREGRDLVLTLKWRPAAAEGLIGASASDALSLRGEYNRTLAVPLPFRRLSAPDAAASGAAVILDDPSAAESVLRRELAEVIRGRAVPAFITAALRLNRDGLRPIGRSRFRRQLRTLSAGDALLELALDEGELFGPPPSARREPLRELELELKDGNLDSLIQIGEAFRRHYGLRAEPRSKFSRILALMDGGSERPGTADGRKEGGHAHVSG